MATPLLKAPKKRGTSAPPSITYAAAAKCVPEPAGWTKVTPRKTKSVKTKTMVNSKDRKILFSRIASAPQANEADLMLACNVSLRKAGVNPQIRIAKVRYSVGGKIAANLTEKAPAKAGIKEYLDLLTRAAREVDQGVNNVEALDTWPTSTGVKVKKGPFWVQREDGLDNRYHINQQRTATVRVWLSTREEADMLCSKGHAIGRKRHEIKMWHEAGP
ncbi:MAG: hypothetical protein MMC33_010685, partial [Icmadophila ericetorum]|nr:hypothetical protein [Icmadophila ericetorum]